MVRPLYCSSEAGFAQTTKESFVQRKVLRVRLGSVGMSRARRHSPGWRPPQPNSVGLGTGGYAAAPGWD